MKSLLAAICILGSATLSSAVNAQTPLSRKSAQEPKTSGVMVTSVQLVKGGMNFSKSSLRTSDNTPRIQEKTIGGGEISITGRQRCFEIYGACGSWYIWESGGTGQQAYQHALDYYNIVIC